jgi:CCR4-NOT transcription complex subunit 6
VHTLLKGLEKIATSADIPMLVCGDFNSVPGRYDELFLKMFHFILQGLFICLYKSYPELCCSAPHSLLAMGKVDPSHPDLTVDPLNILRPLSKLVHQLPLVIYSLKCILKVMAYLKFVFTHSSSVFFSSNLLP